MAKMLLDSIQNAESDMQTRALLEARTEAQNIVLSAEKFVRQNEAILNAEENQQTQALTEALRQSMAGTDKDAINQAMEALNAYTTPLAHRAMDHSIVAAMKGKKI